MEQMKLFIHSTTYGVYQYQMYFNNTFEKKKKEKQQQKKSVFVTVQRQ